MEEVWRDVRGYEGLYKVSNVGRVMVVNSTHSFKNGMIMRTHKREGFHILGLSKNKKQYCCSLHHLVAEAFVDNPNNCKHVIHKDGNKDNNLADNLFWACVEKKMYGFGINDVGRIYLSNGKEEPAYRAWSGMLLRCYDENHRFKHPTYKDCVVCDEWAYYSNFKKWFEDPTNGYIEGYRLDKDIIVKGNKVYSPENCCLVPHEINTLFTKNNKARGKYPIGVGIERSGRYRAKLQPNGRVLSLGTYSTPEEAFEVYKAKKEERIKVIAEEYYKEGKITERVYKAMLRYKVEITD